MKATLLSTIGAVALLGLSSAASAGVINFEGGPFTNGFDLIANSPNLPIANSSLTFSVSGSGLGSDSAIVFDTTPGVNPADPDMFADFTDIDTQALINPGNIAVIGSVNSQGQVDDTNNQGSMIFTLSEAVDFVSFRVFDVGDNPGNLTVQYRDAGGTLLGSENVGGGTSDNETQLIQFGATGAEIASFEFGGSGGIDDITFTTQTPPPPVPVPATAALLGGGLIGLGMLARRRRQAA